MGMFFDHAQTAEATRTAAIDMAARRARIAERLLNESEELLDDLKRPYVDHAFTVTGEYVQHGAMPRPQDKSYLTRAAGNLLTEHRRLTEFDAAGDGAENAKSMLGALFDGLAKAVASEIDAPDDPG